MDISEIYVHGSSTEGFDMPDMRASLYKFFGKGQEGQGDYTVEEDEDVSFGDIYYNGSGDDICRLNGCNVNAMDVEDKHGICSNSSGSSDAHSAQLSLGNVYFKDSNEHFNNEMTAAGRENKGDGTPRGEEREPYTLGCHNSTMLSSHSSETVSYALYSKGSSDETNAFEAFYNCNSNP